MILFKKRKMEMQKLQHENEQLRIFVKHLSANLAQADENIKQLKINLEQVSQQNIDLVNQVNHLNMTINNFSKKNETKFY